MSLRWRAFVLMTFCADAPFALVSLPFVVARLSTRVPSCLRALVVTRCSACVSLRWRAFVLMTFCAHAPFALVSLPLVVARLSTRVPSCLRALVVTRC